MPTKWVCPWQPADASKPDNDVIFDQACNELNRANVNGWINEGAFKSTAEYFEKQPLVDTYSGEQPFIRDHVTMFTLHEEPNKCYWITNGELRIYEGDVIDAVSQCGYCNVSSDEIVFQEYCFQGVQYGRNDIKMRVGKYTSNGTETGSLVGSVFMEFEYLPTYSLGESKGHMYKALAKWNCFVQSAQWPGYFSPVIFHWGSLMNYFLEYGLSDHYSAHHTVLQYYHATKSLSAAYANR